MTNLPLVVGQPGSGTTLHLVGFTVGDEEFCVDILKVQEIIRMVAISAMPNAPDYIEGIINLRGRIIPIIDFRKRFHILCASTVDERAKRIVVVSLNTATIGLVVDSVSQVFKLVESQISPAPEVAKGYDAEAIVGIGQMGEKLLIILDVEQMFSGMELTGMDGLERPGAHA